MGNISSDGLQIEKISSVNLNELWHKHCKSDEMDQMEFIQFILSLSSILSAEIKQSDLGPLFNSLQKSGKVSWLKFDSAFDSWSNKKMQEISGVEVLMPCIPLSIITKTYELTIPPDTIVYKKLSFTNPHDYLKILKIHSTNQNILIIRNPQIRIAPQESEFIKFKLKASLDCEVFIVISHVKTGISEETLSIKVLIEDRPRTPTRPPSGNLNKNKSWNFTPRRPTPRRNSGED